MEYVIPAAIVLVGNVFSRSRGSRQWEVVSALFAWVAAITGALWLLCLLLGSEFWARQIFFPTWAFCLLQVLSRDYVKILKPIADRWSIRRNRGE